MLAALNVKSGPHVSGRLHESTEPVSASLANSVRRRGFARTCNAPLVDDATRTTAITALGKLWSEGCPLAEPGSLATVLEVGWRRWRSFDRRDNRRHPDRDDRIEDLAKGLCSAMESEQKLVGPLMQHYRCLAIALASAFDPI
jgi:hypothetical protein